MYRVRWPWASRSMRSTRWPNSARAAPRFTAVVVLPTPPFCMATAIVRAKIGPSLTEAEVSGPETRTEPSPDLRRPCGPSALLRPARLRSHASNGMRSLVCSAAPSSWTTWAPNLSAKAPPESLATRMAPPLIIDVVVVLVLIVALIVGYQRGVIQPLMAEIFFFGTLLAVFRFHEQYTNAMLKYLHL